MALWDATKSFFSGNFKDSASYLFVDADEVNRGRDLDARLAELNSRDLASNKITDEEYLRRTNAIATNAFEHGGIFDQEGTDVFGGFVEGAGEGLTTMQQGVKSGIAKSLNFTTGLIPWQLWVLIAIYVAFRLGLLDKIFKSK